MGPAAADALDLEALETALRRQVKELAARTVEAHLNQDHSDATPSHSCSCGGTARYAGRRTKRFATALGPMRLGRAYFHCGECGHGFCPRDRALGLEGSSLSPALMRMVGAVASLVSFQESSQLLEELAGVDVGAKQVQRSAQALGEEVADYERQTREPDDGLSLPATLYLGLDGTGVPMRPTEVAGRAGKQPDGSSRTREAKLCTVWSAERRDAQGRPQRDPGSVTYTAAIESAATRDTDPQLSEFAQRVEREAQRRRFGQAPRQVVLGDGAKWIWGLTGELFPEAVQIVDRFHAKERLHRLSKSLYADRPSAREWAEQRCGELDSGRIETLLSVLAAEAAHHEEGKAAWTYFHENRHRMRYARFEAQGLCTSIGVVEAGCKNAIGARLKRSGMHWSVRGANSIMALRCVRLSGRFEDFWEWRANSKAAA
ncbi:MAG: ISKra4 family transposase [Candidatus Aminicenantes bacterium]|nr:ISKra4 family transposase [Candidatus Aminicenantes bacterium]